MDRQTVDAEHAHARATQAEQAKQTEEVNEDDSGDEEARRASSTNSPTTANHQSEERPLYETNPLLGLLSPWRLSGADSTDGGPSPSPGVSKETSEKENGTSPATRSTAAAGGVTAGA